MGNDLIEALRAGHLARVRMAIKSDPQAARRARSISEAAGLAFQAAIELLVRHGADLNAATFSDLTVPLINNWQAREIRTAAEARQGLYEQVPNPVRWSDSIGYLAGHGVGRFIEVGAGSVLTGLQRSIDPAL